MVNVSVTFGPFSGIYFAFRCCILMPEFGRNMTETCVLLNVHSNKIILLREICNLLLIYIYIVLFKWFCPIYIYMV